MKKRKFKKHILYLIACIVLVIEVYPIVWTFMTSFKTQEEIRWGSSIALPQSIHLDNYIKVLAESQLPVYFKNSVIVTFVTIFLLIVLSATSGFALQKLRFKGQGLVLGFFMAGITTFWYITISPIDIFIVVYHMYYFNILYQITLTLQFLS